MHQPTSEIIQIQDNEVKAFDKEQQEAFTPEALGKIKESIDNVVNSDKNTSALTEMAKAWGVLPWWSKGIVFFLLLTPTLAVALVTQTLWVILAVAAVNAFIALLYVGFSLLLDNYDAVTKENRGALKAVMDGMADFLGKVIFGLQDFAAALGFEVKRYAKEIDTLSLTVTNISAQNRALNAEVTCFQEQNAALTKTNSAIKQSSDGLEVILTKERERFEEQEKIRKAYEAELSQRLQDLEAKISELTIINEDLGKELTHVKAIAQTLSETNASLIAITVDYDAAREDFISQTQNACAKKNQRMDSAVNVFSDAASSLQNTVQAFQQTIGETAKLAQEHRELKIQPRPSDGSMFKKVLIEDEVDVPTLSIQ